MVYCIDSNIIVWGIKRQATSGQEEMIVRAEALFKRFDEYKDSIIIPTVVLAEILAPEPPVVRAKYLEILGKSFNIAQFDSRAAMKYAEIMHARFEEIKTIANTTGIHRQKMKMDHIVIATAIVNEANCIYSTDGGLKAFANGYIDVNDLPPIRATTPTTPLIQTDLFSGLISKESDE
jgi:predicted nucleic acid-binding protein